ncbi:MAG: hypothetical protein M3401_13345 [Actinomycetota bacterium]|nr:hypothetical protein [Actinomycetota bacterium]
MKALSFVRDKVVPVVFALPPFLILVLVGWGAGILVFGILDGWFTVLGLAVLALLIVLRISLPVSTRWLGAVVVAVLSVLALNALWARVGLERPDPVPGVIAAAAVIVLVVWVYYRSWWVDGSLSPSGAWLWGGALAVALVVVLPVGYGLVKQAKADKPEPSTDLASQLEVIVISGADGLPPLQTTDGSGGWELDYFTGSAEGRRIKWIGERPPPPRKGADRVLVLAVDGVPRTLADADQLANVPAAPAEVDRWRAVAKRVPGWRSTPTFALLRASDARLADWRDTLKPLAPGERGKQWYGGVRSVQALAGPRTLGDVALRLAVNSPTSDEDLSLAGQYRPLLLFDDGERGARPLNVDSLLARDEFDLCGDHQLRVNCSDVHSWRDLRNGAYRLSFDTNTLKAATDDTMIYVHVTRHRTGRRDLVYLDYWWYLPDNPTNAGEGGLCGAGLIIPEVTCFDHQSDWEGVTVAIDPDLPERSVVGQFESSRAAISRSVQT